MLTFIFLYSTFSILCFGDHLTVSSCPDRSIFIDESNYSIWKEFVEFGEIAIYFTADLVQPQLYIDISENISEINQITIFGIENKKVNIKNQGNFISTAIYIRNVIAVFSFNTISCSKLVLINTNIANDKFTFNCTTLELDEYCFSWIFVNNILADNLEIIIPDQLQNDFTFPYIPQIKSYSFKNIKSNYSLEYYHNKINFVCQANGYKLNINMYKELPFIHVDNSGESSFLTIKSFTSIGIPALSYLSISLSSRSYLVIPQDISSLAGNPLIDTSDGGNIIQECTEMNLRFERGSGRHTLSLLLGESATRGGIIPLVQEDKTVISQIKPSKQEFYPTLFYGNETGALRTEGKDLNLFLKGGLYDQDPTAISGDSEVSFKGFALFGSKLIVPNAKISGESDIIFKFTENKAPALEITGNVTNDANHTIRVYMDENYQRNETTNLICADNLICKQWTVICNDKYVDHIPNGIYNYTKTCEYYEKSRCIQLIPTKLELPKYRILCHYFNESECPKESKFYTSDEELNSFLPQFGKATIYFQKGTHTLDINSKLNTSLSLICEDEVDIQVSNVTFENTVELDVGNCNIHSYFEEGDVIQGNSLISKVNIDENVFNHVKFNTFTTNYEILSTSSNIFANNIHINFEEAMDFCNILYDTDHLVINTSKKIKEINSIQPISISADFRNSIRKITIEERNSQNIEKLNISAASNDLIFNISSLVINSHISLENNGSTLIYIDKNYSFFSFPLRDTKVEVAHGSLNLSKLLLSSNSLIEINGAEDTIISDVKLANNATIIGQNIKVMHTTLESFSKSRISFKTNSIRILPSSETTLSYLPETLEVNYNLQSIPYIQTTGSERNVQLVLNYIEDVYEPVERYYENYFFDPLPFICGENSTFNNWNYNITSSRLEFNGSTSIIEIRIRKIEKQNCLCMFRRFPPSTPTPYPTIKPTVSASISPSKSPDPTLCPTNTPLPPTPSQTPVPWINSSVGISVISASSASTIFIVIAGYFIYKKSKKSDLLVTIANESLISNKSDVFE